MIAVSPMIRPMPSTMPLAMPGRIAGSSTLRIVVARVLPSAKDASRRRPGSCVSASRVAPTISGSASTDMHAPATRKDWAVTVPSLARWERKPRNPCEKMIKPKIASTMLGTPAIISIAGLDRPREPRRPPVLRQPAGERHSRRERRSRCRSP